MLKNKKENLTQKFVIDPETSGESSYDELDEFLINNNFKDNFIRNFQDKQSDDYKNLCQITQLYFSAYANQNYPNK